MLSPYPEWGGDQDGRIFEVRMGSASRCPSLPLDHYPEWVWMGCS
ncbi:MAG: hypothetical protein ACKPCM_00275 [Pseudanabaena sp.]